MHALAKVEHAGFRRVIAVVIRETISGRHSRRDFISSAAIKGDSYGLHGWKRKEQKYQT